MGCVPKLALAVLNFVLLVLSLATFGGCIYLYVTVFRDAPLWHGVFDTQFMLYMLGGSFLGIVVSILGLMSMKQDKKCVRFTYFILLFAVFVLEVAVVMEVFNTGSTLLGKEAKQKVGTAKDTAENKGLEYARLATSDLYKAARCTGGDPTEPVDSVDSDEKAAAVKFNDVTCKKESVQKLFNYFLKDQTFKTKEEATVYTKCMKADAPPPTAAVALAAADTSEALFCRAKGQIMTFISKYQTYAKIVPIVLAFFTLILIVAAIRVMCCGNADTLAHAKVHCLDDPLLARLDREF